MTVRIEPFDPRPGPTGALHAPPTHSAQTDSRRGSFWCSCKQRWQSIRSTVHTYPSTLVVPIIVFLALVAGGVAIVLVASSNQVNVYKRQATVDANAAAGLMMALVHDIVQPISSLALFIRSNPYYPSVIQQFPSLTGSLLDQVENLNSSSYVQLAPLGKIVQVYPETEQSLKAVGLDFLDDKITLENLQVPPSSSQRLTMHGPLILGGEHVWAIIGAAVVFVPNVSRDETFGMPPSLQRECPAHFGSVCYDEATRSKFWGLLWSVVYFDSLVAYPSAALTSLRQKDYDYMMIQEMSDLNATPGLTGPNGFNATLLARSDGDLSADPVVATIAAPPTIASFNPWTLMITRSTGWVPFWKDPLIATAVIVPAIIGVLLFILLLYMRQHQMLLFALVPRKMVQSMFQADAFEAIVKEDADNRGSMMLDAGTPVERLMDILTQLMMGKTPELRDVVSLRAAIMHGGDVLFEPQNLRGQLELNKDLPDDVVDALLRQLQGRAPEPVTPAPIEKQISMDSMPDDKSMGRLSVALSLIMRSPGMQEFPLSVDGSNHSIRANSQDFQGPLGGRRVLTPLGSKLYPHGCRRGSRTSASLPSSGVQEEGPAVQAEGSEAQEAGLAAQAEAPAAQVEALVAQLEAPAAQGEGPAQGAEADTSPAQVDTPRAEGGTPRARGEDVSMTVVVEGEAAGASCSGPLVVRRSPSQLQQHKLVVPQHSPSDQVEQLLESAYGSWTFNAFELSEATNGHPLSVTLFFLLVRSGLMKDMKLNPSVAARLALAIEEGYFANPYHNKTHAADVLQTMHTILVNSGMVVAAGQKGYCPPETLLACLLAAAGHDVGHTGVTNDFLIHSEDQLATLYNDRSPMENHHLAHLWTLLRNPSLNILSTLHKEDRAKIRKIVIDLVSATDMKNHFSLLSQFSVVHQLSGNISAINTAPSPAPISAGGSPSGKWGPMVAVDSSLAATQSVKAPLQRLPLDDVEQMLSLQIALKCADLGHIAEATEVHCRWVSCLEEEFFAQGDRERSLGLPISPLFDRTKPGASKSQIGFYDFVVLPLFHNFSCAFPGAKSMVDLTLITYKYWKTMAPAADVS